MKRDASLDVSKAIAIFLVVFIHVSVYAPISDAYRTPFAVENFCWISVMPLFFMICGLFSRRLLTELKFGQFSFRLVAYLWPVLTMIGAVGIAVRLIMGEKPVPPSGLLDYLMSVGWFFFCLALCESVTFGAHWLSRGRIGLRILLLSLGYFALWAIPFGMFHAVEMLPFFWFGIYALPRLYGTRHGTVGGLVAFAIVLVACCALGDFRMIGLAFHLTSMGLLSFSGYGLVLMLERIVLGALAAFGLMTLVRVILLRFSALGWLACLGTQTMGVFFIHIQLLAVYYSYVHYPVGGPVGRFVLACVFLTTSHGLAVLSRKNAVVGAVIWNPLELRLLRSGKGVT